MTLKYEQNTKNTRHLRVSSNRKDTLELKNKEKRKLKEQHNEQKKTLKIHLINIVRDSTSMKQEQNTAKNEHRTTEL